MKSSFLEVKPRPFLARKGLANYIFNETLLRNMRKVLLLLVPFLLVGLASAAATMYIGDTTTVSGQILKVLTIYEDCSAMVQVNDGLPKIVTSAGKQVDTLWVNSTGCFFAGDSSFVYLDIRYNAVTSNCDEDKDCNDNNYCTMDFCTGNPKRCDYASSHFLITDCMANDKCCPSNCTWKTDNDCPGVECEEDKECMDTLCWTNTSCVSGKCQTVIIAGCKIGDYCCPPNCFYTTKLETGRDNDCSELSQCVNNSQCDDNRTETSDSCILPEISTEPRICSHKINSSFSFTSNVSNVSAGSTAAAPPVATGNQTNNATSLSQQGTVIVEKFKANKKVLLMMLAVTAVFVVIILILKRRNV